MKFVGILALLVVNLFMSGCGPSIDVLSETVRNSMQKDFDTNEVFKSYGLKVGKLNLVHEEDNKYIGSAVVALDGKTVDLKFYVIVDSNDNDKFNLEIPPESIRLLAKLTYFKDLNRQVLNSMQKEFDTNEAFKSHGLKIDNFGLVHEQGNKYIGSATVVFEGNTRQLKFYVVADSNGKFILDIPAEAFWFLN